MAELSREAQEKRYQDCLDSLEWQAKETTRLESMNRALIESLRHLAGRYCASCLKGLKRDETGHHGAYRCLTKDAWALIAKAEGR